MKLLTATRGLGVAALIGAASSVSGATLLLNLGDFSNALATTATTAGLTLVTSMSSGGGTADFAATLDTEVYKDGAGLLTFFYRVSNNAGSARPLQGLTIPLEVAVGSGQIGVDQDLSGKTATYASLDSGGGTVGFTWVGSQIMTAGTSGSWVMVQTPFKTYKPGLVGVQDGTTANLNSLTPIPEPATYAGLFALGLAGFAAFRRFRA